MIGKFVTTTFKGLGNQFTVVGSSKKLLGNLPMGILDLLTPSPDPSGTSMSSKTPGKDFDDRWSLDYVPDIGSQ